MMIMDIENFHTKYGSKLDELGFYTDGKLNRDEKGNLYIEYKNFKEDSPFLYAKLIVKEDKNKKKLIADLQVKFTIYWNLSLRKLFYILKNGITEKDEKYTHYNW